MQSGFEIDETIVAQLIDMDAPAEIIAAARREIDVTADFELYEDCALSVAVFRRMSTQWRTRGMDGDLIGLDYVPLPFVMRMLKVPPAQRPAVFDDLGEMESETLNLMAERRRNQQ